MLLEQRAGAHAARGPALQLAPIAPIQQQRTLLAALHKGKSSWLQCTNVHHHGIPIKRVSRGAQESAASSSGSAGLLTHGLYTRQHARRTRALATSRTISTYEAASTAAHSWACPQSQKCRTCSGVAKGSFLPSTLSGT